MEEKQLNIFRAACCGDLGEVYQLLADFNEAELNTLEANCGKLLAQAKFARQERAAFPLVDAQSVPSGAE